MNDGRQAGFTLLEVLVALAVLGVLLLVLRHGVAFGVIASDTQAGVISDREERDAAARVLRRLVEQMDPGTAMEPVRLDLGPHALSFPTVLPAAASASPQRGISAALLVDAEGRLVLRWTPRRHAAALGPPPPLQETELLRGVAGLDASYWRPSPGTGSWLSQWSRPTLPALVRLRVVFPPGDRRHWPDLVAAPSRESPQG